MPKNLTSDAGGEDARTAQPVDDDVVLFIDDLARILKTSTRTIRKQLRAGTFFIPEMPKIDHLPRQQPAMESCARAQSHRGDDAR
jgi:hypothetical protein